MHTGGEGKYSTPLRQISKHLLIKMHYKTRNRGTPQAIFPESLDPPRDFGKKDQVPPPLDFQPVCIYGSNLAKGNHNTRVHKGSTA
jgi:hypothetical protein